MRKTSFSEQVGHVSATRAGERDTSARDFSRDGCRTEADIRARRDMLRNVASGIESGSVLTRERAWKA